MDIFDIETTIYTIDLIYLFLYRCAILIVLFV